MITGVVLAAGAGRRLGQPKAGVVLDGRPLLDRAISTLRAGGCARVLAVVRPDTAPPAFDPDVELIVNPAPDEGMGSSLRLALQAVSDDPRARAALIVLVDQIGIVAADVAAVIAAFDRDGGVTVARRGGHRSH